MGLAVWSGWFGLVGLPRRRRRKLAPPSRASRGGKKKRTRRRRWRRLRRATGGAFEGGEQARKIPWSLLQRRKGTSVQCEKRSASGCLMGGGRGTRRRTGGRNPTRQTTQSVRPRVSRAETPAIRRAPIERASCREVVLGGGGGQMGVRGGGFVSVAVGEEPSLSIFFSLSLSLP